MSDKSMLDNVKIVLRSLAVSSPSDNLTMEQLNKDYRKMEGHAIPFSKLGYYNLKEFLLSIPDTLTLNLHTGRVGPVVTSKNEHVHKFVTDTKSSQRIRKSRLNSNSNSNRCDNSRQQNTNKAQRAGWDTAPTMYNQSYVNHQYNPHNYNMSQSMVQQSNNYIRHSPGNLLAPPSSLTTNSLPQNIAMMELIYQQSRNSLNVLPLPTPNVYSNNINPILGAESIHRRTKGRNVSSGLNISSTVNRRRTEDNHKSKTETKSTDPSPSNESKEMNGSAETSSEEIVNEVDALPPLEDDDPIHSIGVQRSRINFGKSIPAELFPKPGDLKPGDIRQIDITEISNSWSFFFQFYETRELLEDLHNKLSSSYEIECEDLKIETSRIDVGNLCAAFYCDKWMRAEILAEPDENDEVKLCLIDFGTIVSNIFVQNIRRLLSELCIIPRLCYRGVLAFLEPTNNLRIEKTVTKMFCEMVQHKSMMAVITDIEEDTIVMTVIDTSLPDEDVIINKVLFEKLLAANERKQIL